MHLRSDKSGRLVVELVLVLPFLLLLVLVSSEITRYVRIRQAVAVLVGEAGRSVYKSCRDFLEIQNPAPTPTWPRNYIPPNYTATKDRTRMCVEDVMNRDTSSGFSTFATQLAPYLNLPSIDLRVTVYAYSTVLNGRPGDLSVLYTYPPTGGKTSRFSISGTSLSGPLSVPASFVTSHQRFVIAEGWFTFDGVFTKAFKLGSLGNASDGEVYDAAIY